jgi:hypothetical protein
MADPEIGYFRGSGGIVFDFALPLSEQQQHQLTRGELVRVNEDGSAYTESEPLRQPALNASKAEWVGYARAVDPELRIDDADAMTRNDLAEKYGSK